MRPRALWTATLLAGVAPILAFPVPAATEDIEFVAEHLAEAAMDNRDSTLPIWARAPATESWGGDIQAAYTHTTVGGLKLQGPMASLAATRPIGEHWAAGAFVFVDVLDFSAQEDRRPLNPLFSRSIPLALPAEALFTGLNGSARDVGFGLFMEREGTGGWLGERRWVAGLMWQKVSLRDYRLTYTLLSGSDVGAIGSIDYSADYNHLAPFAGLEIRRHIGRWSFSPRVLAALPQPRRGVQGCITGVGFDICGDTVKAGRGKPFGDPFLALGMGVGYEPWGLTLDIGGTVAQALIEPLAHKGIDRNWLVSLDWRF